MISLRTSYKGRIAAMVSGGVDSMTMLDLLIKSGADVFAVHVNHKIREEAALDCEFVRDYCNQNGIEFVGYTFDIPTLAAKNRRSVETEARIIRRQVADELLNSKRADLVAVAHNADDNAETVLMHLLRGSGLDGLRGIRDDGQTIRPLLPFTRAEIEEYASVNGVKYVTDKTNLDTKYTRNFVRLELLPLIRTRYPGVTDALNRLAACAEETIDALDVLLDRSLIRREGNCVKLSLEALSSPLRSRYIYEAAKMLMPIDLTRVQIEGVLALERAGAKAELANSLKAYRDYDCITLCFDQEKREFIQPFREGTVELSGCTVKISEVEPRPIKGKTIIACPVPSGAVLRNRREGDSFTPFGSKRKSLKKYLIDKKIPARFRDGLVCLCDGSEVLAVVGLEISDKMRITPETERAYLLETL